MKTADDIRSLLLKGEKIDLECKEAEKQIPSSIYETYSSFTNTVRSFLAYRKIKALKIRQSVF